MSNLDEFEEQLKQEALAKEAEEVQTSEHEYSVGGKLFRKDADGTTFEFDEQKRAWFPQIDEDFIARYQMSYGTGADPSTVDPNSCADSYWSHPPSDINSEEYRNWYNQYCSYFYPQQFMAQAAAARANQEEQTDSGDAEVNEFKADLGENHSGKGDRQEDDGRKKKKKKNTDLLTKHKPVEPPAWFELEDDKNTNVYISGLPEDITEDEFKDFMSKVGVVAFDPVARKAKLKLYSNEDGTYKGDGRCCYIKPESVDLALQILDSSEIRGHKISVERAHFELKGSYDPSKKRRKLTKQEKKKWQEKQEKILGWQPEKPDNARPSSERIVVIKHAFLPHQFEQDPAQLNEISSDFREECSKYGDVRRVVVCDRHPEGVVMVTFRTPEEADACIAVVNGRWFAGIQLEASNWDGRTKYHVKETQEEMEKRLASWHSFLESEANEDAKDGKSTVKSPVTRSDDDDEGVKVSDINVPAGDATSIGETTEISLKSPSIKDDDEALGETTEISLKSPSIKDDDEAIGETTEISSKSPSIKDDDEVCEDARVGDLKDGTVEPSE